MAAVDVLLFVRNNWVFKTRMKWIRENMDGYLKAVSYYQMMFAMLNWSREAKDWESKV